ncbi:hypothetical protein Tresu_0269 [Treponema succinifaciens DSM 2489]|uniref:Uncharacterized protein n=1 Tax=Treponema succinifaciens (strain ATCC 33096 / DSM 2489 / 6091) TaxID=869209 RepID=F2NUD5_TRES6|nr:hypothetical protein Tresu_0269 [Treponema succinifaciens DSM 2489]
MPYATVCPGLLYSLSVVAIQSVWGVSTIRLGQYAQAEWDVGIWNYYIL